MLSLRNLMFHTLHHMLACTSHLSNTFYVLGATQSGGTVVTAPMMLSQSKMQKTIVQMISWLWKPFTGKFVLSYLCSNILFHYGLQIEIPWCTSPMEMFRQERLQTHFTYQNHLSYICLDAYKKVCSLLSTLKSSCQN